ncbi:hypothetical protein H2Y56_00390 [Pectobacterium aroidearum]|uniref:Uncharacterized protein n=1 Tax=Pectobacterium aroidearum TaxID=1201031 RepID=A0ABR5Z7M9_9GAMM|nr:MULTISPECIES: hypothetical protein [Pectobacterium]MBA5197781.1 hypothetical protein [Pectobacterium aroidearum]MBA5230574.1 hypothetical protein [Pectobacterium aroidearum]GKV95456.1 hypothetical protein PEC301645_29030 [Pectobacterium carotovorum subsp. carotovorum]
MRNLLKETHDRILREENNSYIRRVSWLDLHDKVYYFFQFLESNKNADIFGSFYFSSNQDYTPYSENRNIYRLNSLNQIQIHTGHRISSIYHAGKGNKLEVIYEKASTLWFSQDITGGVAVFLSPYISSTHRVDEENVLIKYYHQPTSITNKEVKKILKTYIKYCEATMAFSTGKRGLYFFRLWLQFKDLRNRKKIKAFSIKIIAQALALLLAGLGVVATLYTGNVIKF